MSLSADLVEILAEHLARFPSDELVFTSSEGEVLRATNFRRRVWLPATSAAGLDGVRFHDLRHTAAAWLIEAGAHPKVIASRLGHKSVRTVLDVYGHLLEGLDEAAAEAVLRRRRPPPHDHNPRPAPRSWSAVHRMAR